jgi:2-deoxy-D-gluconate 3-dehydrogenase
VVNNAGGSNFMVGFRDLRLSGWDKLMRLNLDSAMYVCHAFAGRLLDRRHGSIINVAPVAGGGLILAAGALRRSKGRPDLADEIAGRRMGRRRHPGQCPVPGLDGYGPQSQPRGRSGRQPRHRRYGDVAALGDRGGDGEGRRFPGERCGVFMTGQVLIVAGGQTISP